MKALFCVFAAREVALPVSQHSLSCLLLVFAWGIDTGTLQQTNKAAKETGCPHAGCGRETLLVMHAYVCVCPYSDTNITGRESSLLPSFFFSGSNAKYFFPLLSYTLCLWLFLLLR